MAAPGSNEGSTPPKRPQGPHGLQPGSTGFTWQSGTIRTQLIGGFNFLPFRFLLHVFEVPIQHSFDNGIHYLGVGN